MAVSGMTDERDGRDPLWWEWLSWSQSGCTVQTEGGCSEPRILLAWCIRHESLVLCLVVSNLNRGNGMRTLKNNSTFPNTTQAKKSHLRLINQILHIIFVIQYYNAFEFKWIFILLTQWGFDSNSERYNWGSKPAKNELRPPRASWIALHFLPAVCSVLMSYSQRTLR